MNAPFMQCGHTANAVRSGTNEPVCIVCLGITEGADKIAESKPDLDGRVATCGYCRRERSSDFGLAFFEYRPESKSDSYYCGCRGWD